MPYNEVFGRFPPFLGGCASGTVFFSPAEVNCLSGKSLGFVDRSRIEQFLADPDSTVLPTREAMQWNAAFGLLPGSFNPPHDGHLGMLDFARRNLQIPTQLELSVTNVDKPPLTVDDVWQRLDGLLHNQEVWLTKAPTFVEKSAVFHDCRFLVGADTIVRIADPAYYEGSTERRDQAIDHLQQRQATFVVFGRLAEGHFRDGSNLELPAKLTAMSRFVTESEFRLDVSSSQLRGDGA